MTTIHLTAFSRWHTWMSVDSALSLGLSLLPALPMPVLLLAPPTNYGWGKTRYALAAPHLRHFNIY